MQGLERLRVKRDDTKLKNNVQEEISIVTFLYNHASAASETMESLLMQKTRHSLIRQGYKLKPVVSGLQSLDLNIAGGQLGKEKSA